MPNKACLSKINYRKGFEIFLAVIVFSNGIFETKQNKKIYRRVPLVEPGEEIPKHMHPTQSWEKLQKHVTVRQSGV